MPIETKQARFGGIIGRNLGTRRETRHRPHENDSASARKDWECCTRQQKMSAQVDSHDPIPLLWGGIRQETTKSDANVADQTIDCSGISYQASAYISVSDITL